MLRTHYNTRILDLFFEIPRAYNIYTTQTQAIIITITLSKFEWPENIYCYTYCTTTYYILYQRVVVVVVGFGI